MSLYQKGFHPSNTCHLIKRLNKHRGRAGFSALVVDRERIVREEALVDIPLEQIVKDQAD